MKNKFRKVIATLVVGVTLCGSILTAQAAEGCTHSTATRYSYTVYSPYQTHTYGNGQVCKYRVVSTYGTVYCTKCGATVQTDVLMSATTEHSAQH